MLQNGAEVVNQEIPFNKCCTITQSSSFCDILCPCKKNSFTISNEDKQNGNVWTVIEESNYFYNYFFCQFRYMNLYVKDNQIYKYVAERFNTLNCDKIMMKIKQLNPNVKLGEISTCSQKECENSNIFSIPCMKITNTSNYIQDYQVNQQTFVITRKIQTLPQFYRRQCCLCHGTVQYEIYLKVEQQSKQVGLIENEFQGCYKEYCTRGDKFQIQFLDEEIDTEAKILLIFGCLQLNYQEYETMINLP